MAAEGVVKRHSRNCPKKAGGRCRCNAGYEAWVFDHRHNGGRGGKIRKSGFASAAAAKGWRRDALAAQAKGALRAPTVMTLQQAWGEWYPRAQRGTAQNRSGDQFKPAALRSYERAMRLRVLPRFGAVRLSDLDRPSLQAFASELQEEGRSASNVRGTFLPLRAVLRDAVDRGVLLVNACDGLRLPAVRGGRDRIVSPADAARLIDVAPEADRALWATAFYSGLRRGELQALRVKDVDLTTRVLRVERGWDDKEGPILPKSKAARRRVPIPPVLRDFLLTHRVTLDDREPDDLAFGRTASLPFYTKSLQERADRAWSAEHLERLTLHEARHCFASMMIAAGVNAKALQVFMGHSSIQVTYDLYGHLMPGSEDEAAALLEAYLNAQLQAATEQVQGAPGALTGAPEPVLAAAVASNGSR
jgi:integrase